MKAYVVTTGSIFAVVTLMHIWRAIAEEPHLASDRMFVAITVGTAGLAVWAWRVTRARRA